MHEVDRWIERLLGELDGAGLGGATVVLHGSVARGQYLPGWSDVNLLVILDQLPVATLDRLRPGLTRWLESAGTAPLLFTRGEWARAADVYPLEIAEMRLAYRVLRGADPLVGVAVRPAELRLALERELRGKLFRLRQGYALYGDRPADLARGVLEAISSLLVLFRGVLVLAGRIPPPDPAEVAAETAELAGFEPGVFARAVTRRLQSDWQVGRDEFATLLAGMEAAAAFVDQFTQGEER